MSGWECTKTALSDHEAINLLKEFKEQENLDSNPVKSAQKATCSMYPAPGNILHTGRQLPRTPGPGIMPLLPSQIYKTTVTRQDPFEELFKSITQSSVQKVDNIVPCGRQLPRTPVQKSHQEESAKPDVPKEHPSLVEDGRNPKAGIDMGRISDHSRLFETSGNRLSNNASKDEGSSKRLKEKQCAEQRVSETTKEQKMVSAQHVSNADEVHENNRKKELKCQKPVNRRISELPVQGLNRMRISGVLRNLPGYECRNEDLEFLKHMECKEKAKVLKAEMLCLRKELTAANQDKEMLLAIKEKVQHDIHKMKESYDRTIQLGRLFLCKSHDPDFVKNLPSEHVLKLLNPVPVREMQLQKSSRLLAAQKELRRKQKALNATNGQNKFSIKEETCNQQVKEAELRVQQLHNEIVEMKSQVEKAQTDLAEAKESLQKKKERIMNYNKNTGASNDDSNVTEADREKLNRRLQRIKHRKDLYLEREKILQRLNLCLQ